MRIAEFVSNSVVDGPGHRVVLRVQGCPHNCQGCTTPAVQDPWFGQSATVNEILDKFIDVHDVDGFTISGGEPFDQALECARLVIDVKHDHPDYTIWVYTGYTYEEIVQANNYVWNLLLDVTDVLVDGRYDVSQKCNDLKYRYSRNQRLIDVVASKRAGKAVEHRI